MYLRHYTLSDQRSSPLHQHQHLPAILPPIWICLLSSLSSLRYEELIKPDWLPLSIKGEPLAPEIVMVTWFILSFAHGAAG